jgi:hypothetical protein
MDPLAGWEKILLGLFAVVILFWFGPGLKTVFQQSEAQQEKDWKGVLIPLALVILFVLLLISMV